MRQQHCIGLLYGTTLHLVTYDDSGMKVFDKSATVCKHCATHVVYANSNTTNMSAHL